MVKAIVWFDVADGLGSERMSLRDVTAFVPVVLVLLPPPLSGVPTVESDLKPKEWLLESVF